jgi:hypothetical protein
VTEPFARTSWVPLEPFLDNLRRAGRGVVRVAVASGSRMFCSGWMITDSLVVVPTFAIDDAAADVSVLMPGIEGDAPSRVEFLPQADASSPLPALLRLATAVPDRAQRLHVASPRPAEPLLLVHHPQAVLEQQVSHGHVLTTTLERLTHDAASAPGSAGAPVLSAETGRILAMHHSKGMDEGSPAPGRALPLAALLDALRGCTAWPEIVAFHQLADVTPTVPLPVGSAAPVAPPPPDAVLLAAAAAWTLDPAALEPADRARLEPLVVEPNDPVWALIPEERRRIAADGTLAALRAARAPSAEPGRADRTLDRIFAGPPYDLAAVPDDELPFWLQAVAWFGEVASDLPTPAQVHRELEGRRVRSRLEAAAGPRLYGRDDELARLRTWAEGDEPRPVLLTGIGGVGKSALVARFALSLPRETVILWLDFDRPDLAPENAVSVLKALGEQLAVQRSGVTLPPVTEATWRASAEAVGTALRGTPTVLVLDGFEVAQHAQRDDELWKVLGLVLAGAPATPVVVSGRAPVPNLRLGGRPALAMPLTGLPAEAARAWLNSRGVDDPAVLEAILRVSDCVPLLLKLAVRLVETGGDVTDVPRRLPRALVDGYLYQRILDRVVDRRLRPLAHDALVLRRLSADVLVAVLDDRMPADLDPAEVIARLTRELALVESSAPVGLDAGALRMRPEVRVATLRLLEVEDVERVRLIDRRAAEWYTGPGAAAGGDPQSRVVAAAEAVYHHVRGGDVAAARAAWLPGCASLLAGADEDVPDGFRAARDWLRAQVGGAEGPAVEVHSWEGTALNRIRDAFARGLDRVVFTVLDERPERSPDSPLLVYDAWALRARGDLPGARRLLDAEPVVAGEVGWARAVVAARCAVLDDDPDGADRLLRVAESFGARWGPEFALAVTAARVRLTVDLASENRLVLAPHRIRNDEVALAPWDVTLPSLRTAVARDVYLSLPIVPTDAAESQAFRHELDLQRTHLNSRSSLRPLRPWLSGDEPGDVSLAPPPGDRPDLLVSHLVRLSGRRWRLVTDGPFLDQVRRAVERDPHVDLIRLALAGTLAPFALDGLRYRDGSSLVACMERAANSASASRVDPEDADRVAELREVLGEFGYSDPMLDPEFLVGDRPYRWRKLRSSGWDSGANALLLYAFGPDPLSTMERRVLGRPELKAS